MGTRHLTMCAICWFSTLDNYDFPCGGCDATEVEPTNWYDKQRKPPCIKAMLKALAQ